MRLLHVYSGNLFGGIEAMLLAIARQKSDSVASEYALCFEGRLSRELIAAGARVHQLAEVRVSRPQTVRRARRALHALLAAGRFDRVICHASWSHAIFGGPIRRAGVPLVVWAHDVLDGRHWTERWARRTPPDLAICNSRFTAASVVSTWASAPPPGSVARGWGRVARLARVRASRPEASITPGAPAPRSAPLRSLAGAPCAAGSHSGVPVVVVHPPVQVVRQPLTAAERETIRAELSTSR